jgi:hypothetical protein
MAETIDDLFDKADWDALAPRMVYYANGLICALKWRGAYLGGGSTVTASGDSFSAEDAFNEAIERFLDGKRSYKFAVTLEQNLKGAISSIVSSWNKSSNREPLTEIFMIANNEGCPSDPIQEAVDRTTLGDCEAIIAERIVHQKAALDLFGATLTTDKELAALFTAYKEEIYLPQEIEAATGIPASRVSELKRKLLTRMQKFIKTNPMAGAALDKTFHATRKI